VEKLTAAVAAGDPPELVSVGAHEVQTLAAGGAVASLEGYLQRSGALRKRDIWPSLLGDVTYRGQVFGLPYGSDLRVLYISVDRYRAAGLDPQQPPRTWDDLEQTIATVHRGAPARRSSTWASTPSSAAAASTAGWSPSGSSAACLGVTPEHRRVPSASPARAAPPKTAAMVTGLAGLPASPR
jgi:ABC-type glycerol-3-phosphate transport system substrate-binding protein